MKIIPVILCGGEGTRLWPNSKNNQPKQFIDFGGWNLFEKTLERIDNPIFNYPIISTNLKYLNKVKYFLKKKKFKKFKIVLEPSKKNTGPAILASTLAHINSSNNEWDSPLIFLSSDHLIYKEKVFYKEIKKNAKKLSNNNIFIFGAKPSFPSNSYGYFLTKKNNNKIIQVTNFVEKPQVSIARKLIQKKAYWNTGMFFVKPASLIYNFNKFCPQIYNSTLKVFSSFSNTKVFNNIYFLDKKLFKKIPAISFDYAVLEKTKNINAIKLNVPWSDLGSWKEILNIYHKNKLKYFNKKNVYHRPWGKYINLYKGKNFLIKELTINSKSSISLQKHRHRAEHWLIKDGKPIITLNNKKFLKKKHDSIFIPQGTIHRIENLYKKPVKIMEVQIGSILKESDIIRYKDIYGRVK